LKLHKKKVSFSLFKSKKNPGSDLSLKYTNSSSDESDIRIFQEAIASIACIESNYLIAEMKQVQDKLNHNLKRGWCLHQMSKCRLEA
jgi:hypothetical protein